MAMVASQIVPLGEADHTRTSSTGKLLAAFSFGKTFVRVKMRAIRVKCGALLAALPTKENVGFQYAKGMAVFAKPCAAEIWNNIGLNSLAPRPWKALHKRAAQPWRIHMIGPVSLLDVAIVAVPVLLVLLGYRYGATGIMFYGLTRLFLSLILFGLIMYILAASRSGLVIWYLDSATGSLGPIQALAAIVLPWLFFFLVYYFLGLAGRRLRRLVQSPRSRVLDRRIGVFAGAVLGLLITMGIVVLPAMQFKLSHPQANEQPNWLRESVFLPPLEQIIARALSPYHEKR